MSCGEMSLVVRTTLMREGESCTAGSLVHRQDRCKCIAKLRGGQEGDSGDEKDGCVEKVCQGKQVCERAEAVLEERGGKLWGSVSVFLAAILGRPVELQVMRQWTTYAHAASRMFKCYFCHVLAAMMRKCWH